MTKVAFRPTTLLFLFALPLLLGSCAPTISTRREAHPASPVPGNLLAGEALRQKTLTEEKNPDSPPHLAKAEELAAWAGQDPRRLAEAATLLLERSESNRSSKPRSSKAANPTPNNTAQALAALELAWRSLQSSGVPAKDWLENGRSSLAARVVNTALARVLAAYPDALATGRGELRLRSALGPLVLRSRYASEGRFGPDYFDTVRPSAYVAIEGFSSRTLSPGMGAAVVGTRQRTPARAEEMKFLPPDTDIHVALGSLAEVRSRQKPGDVAQVKITLYDLDRSTEGRLAGSKVPLAGDFTLPMALAFQGINDLGLGVKVLFDVGDPADYTGIYLTEPYDPERIPVLLIHGLSSSPLVWRNLATKALGVPPIRENYQFWYAFYSSGAPLTPTTALLRSRIAAIRASKDPKGGSPSSREMVIIGYSLGGLIAQMLSTDVGNKFWETISPKPFEDVALDAEDKATLRDWLFWDPPKDISNVVFFATPHRGTRMADASYAQLGRKLIGFPVSVLKFQQRVLGALSDLIGDPSLKGRVLTGIDALSPESPIYEVFAKAPIVSGAKIHSVIGDQGRGDSPESSDGIVGYWSSHLDESDSELIVPTGHDVQTDPNTELEVQKILLNNLQSGSD